ncbi:MAG: hypothetical protein LBV34_14120 [Nocardiopsaceae bacterium]|jgi:hypothetical protein|nr:hypothetical protein [Nocardiopsaceae bacterium]
MSAQFALDTAVLRRQRRTIFLALAAYLPGAAITIGLTAWVAGSGALPAIVIGLSAVQVSWFASVCAFQAIATERMLRRSATPAGRLALTASGGDNGRRQWAWADVKRVRAYRTSTPHLRIYLRQARPALKDPAVTDPAQTDPAQTDPGPSVTSWTGLRRRVIACQSAVYGAGLDELIMAFERYVPVADPDRPLAPARDPGGTTTFFFNHWQLNARRRRNLRSCWQVPLMAIPAAVGLGLAGYWPLSVVALVPAAVLVGVMAGRVRETDRLLGLGKNGHGRLLLTPGDMTLAGTDVPIPWSHVHDTALLRGEEPRVTGVITCPDLNGRCRFANRRIPFSIGARMYATTIDDVAAAFGEHVPVVAHD